MGPETERKKELSLGSIDSLDIQVQDLHRYFMNCGFAQTPNCLRIFSDLFVNYFWV